jgi:hypothetical protein
VGGEHAQAPNRRCGSGGIESEAARPSFCCPVGPGAGREPARLGPLQHLGQPPIPQGLAQPLAILKRAQLQHLGDHPIGMARGLLSGLPPDQPRRQGPRQLAQRLRTAGSGRWRAQRRECSLGALTIGTPARFTPSRRCAGAWRRAAGLHGCCNSGSGLEQPQHQPGL